jgi:hypothetical protein
MSFKKRLPCPACQKDMVQAFVDPQVYRERAKSGEVIEVVHVYYGCPDDNCKTTVRLRFRKDGKEGDLWREMKKRKAEGKVLQDFGGKFGELG